MLGLLRNYIDIPDLFLAKFNKDKVVQNHIR